MAVTVLLPCLNEAETLEICIRKARNWLKTASVTGEVLIADNGSTDQSQAIAVASGARVVNVPTRGYGAAITAGIRAAQGEFVIVADADDSYSLTDLSPFLDQLRSGADLVVGDRFSGKIYPGAMPFLHRYLGNPILSFIGRLFFGGNVRDFHCGLRGFNKQKVLDLNLKAPGMEFASELIVKSLLAGLSIKSIPTDLHPDGRSRPPHLRTWRDGWRHLRFLLSFSPRWLFLYPGWTLLLTSFLGISITFQNGRSIFGITLGLQSFIFSVFSFLIGYQLVWFSILAKTSSSIRGLLPRDTRWRVLIDRISNETMIWAYLSISFIGVFLLSNQIRTWVGVNFGQLDIQEAVRRSMLGFLLLSTGLQSIFYHFLLGIIQLEENEK